MAPVAAPTAAPVVLESGHVLTLYDEGGALAYTANGGHVTGIEAPGDGAVYVTVAVPSLGVLTTELKLLRSTGPGSAVQVGAPQPITLMPWAADLTAGPNGLLYVAGAMGGVGGIYGLDPQGIAEPQAYAAGSCSFATSGLTFAPDGSYALVSTDGSSVTCTNGLYRVWPDGSFEHVIPWLDLPDGIPRGADDHTVTPGGDIILAGDKSHDLWDATAGAGAVELAVDLDAEFTGSEIPGWAGGNPVFGSRIAVHPHTGHLYYTHGSGAPDKLMSIVRYELDTGNASLFAEGFAILRDLDFGPSSSGSGVSLYVLELSRVDMAAGPGDVGAVHEIAFPADGDNDGVADASDNCSAVANADQRDTDSDGFGNLCDADLDNDCAVNFADLALFKERFLGSDLDADLDGSGTVDFGDLAILRSAFLGVPGPSALATCNGSNGAGAAVDGVSPAAR